MNPCKGITILPPYHLPMVLEVFPNESVIVKFVVDPSGYNYQYSERYLLYWLIFYKVSFINWRNAKSWEFMSIRIEKLNIIRLFKAVLCRAWPPNFQPSVGHVYRKQKKQGTSLLSETCCSSWRWSCSFPLQARAYSVLSVVQSRALEFRALETLQPLFICFFVFLYSWPKICLPCTFCWTFLLKRVFPE